MLQVTIVRIRSPPSKGLLSTQSETLIAPAIPTARRYVRHSVNLLGSTEPLLNSV